LLRKAVEIQPKLTRNRIDLAASLIGLGQFDEAEQLLDEVVAEHPKFPLVNFNLGLLYEEQGRLAEARKAYEAEAEHHPKLVPARFNLGNLMLRMGDLRGAEEQLRAAMESAPDEPRPYLLLARMHLASGADLAETEALARQGLERAEADDLKVLGYYLLADVYSRQGRQAELEQVLERAQYYRSRIEGAGG